MAKKTTTKKSKVGKTSKASASRKSAASKTRQKTKTTTAKKGTTAKKAKQTKKASSKRTINLKQLNTVLHGLRGAHILAAAVFAALIALLYVVVDAVVRTITVSYATSNSLTGETEVLAPAVQQVGSVDVRHVVTVLLGLGVVYSLFVATRGWKNYQKRAEAGTLRIRWVFAALSAIVGLIVVALLHGIYDVVSLAVLASLIVLAAYFAYQSEQTKSAPQKGRLFVVSVATGTIAVLAVVAFLGLSMFYGFELLPLHTYILADILALGLLGFAVNQLFQMKKRRGFTKPLQIERNYFVVSGVATVLFAATFILGFMA